MKKDYTKTKVTQVTCDIDNHEKDYMKTKVTQVTCDIDNHEKRLYEDYFKCLLKCDVSGFPREVFL